MAATAPQLARVVFDESHSEAWTIRRELARAMQPAHPADSSYATAADALAAHGFGVACNADHELSDQLLADADVLVIAHPSERRWEATTNERSPRLSPAELDSVERFVERGGGLIVLGETEQDKYGNNLNELLARFGMRIENATVQDYERCREAPSWILPELVGQNGSSGRRTDLLAGVREACLYRAGTLELDGAGRVLARASSTASAPGAPLAAVTERGRGRVIVLADSDLFGDDCFDHLDHASLWLNLAWWAAEPSFAADNGFGDAHSAALSDPAWKSLKAAVEELRLMQEPDGSVDLRRYVRDRVGALATAVAASARALAPRFPHQRQYIDALVADLDDWAAAGFSKPDFMRSTDAFRPERERRDGGEHLVVFPMYKQNASRDTCFEALLVRTPWPEHVAELERSRYDNPKFVPVTFVDHTAGYDSECAVLFPETFSTTERPPSHFGAIFCDREADRFRRVCGRAVEVLGLNLPPDASCLLSSPRLSRDAYVLWDLIHDRTHMHGDLPFDPFMIRQRSPYWMYSLEELRCDLTAFCEAVELERQGFAFARRVQYAVLFDRMLRFPVTGSRVRNYDGLGGQLLFAFLHREGYLHWTDNELRVEWKRVADGVVALRERVLSLYHSGIARSKLAQWLAAHDLVAEYVPPAHGSRWAREARGTLPEVEEPKELVDLVKDDEFPLSLFYVQLQRKLEPALRRPSEGERAAAA
ncbi:MAG: DUF6421 family protein [Thermoleophilaceae bacterium]